MNDMVRLMLMGFFVVVAVICISSLINGLEVDMFYPINNTVHGGPGQMAFAFSVSGDLPLHNCTLETENNVFATKINPSNNASHKFLVDTQDGKTKTVRTVCRDGTDEAYSEWITFSVDFSYIDVYGRVRDSDDGAIPADITIFNDTDIIAESSGINHNFTLPDGSYHANITFDHDVFTSIHLYNISLAENRLKIFKLEDSSDEHAGLRANEIYSIDPESLDFEYGNMKIKEAKHDELFKCPNWDFMAQECLGSWYPHLSLTPGLEYSISLTPTDPGYGEIFLIEAAELNGSRELIRDIYYYVKTVDNESVNISANHSARVTFEQNLTSIHDITIHASSNDSATINVFKDGESEIITTFEPITGYAIYSVMLTNMSGIADTFILEVTSGTVDFDFITDPTTLYPQDGKDNIRCIGGDCGASWAILEVSDLPYSGVLSGDIYYPASAFNISNISTIMQATYHAKPYTTSGTGNFNMTLFMANATTSCNIEYSSEVAFLAAMINDSINITTRNDFDFISDPYYTFDITPAFLDAQSQGMGCIVIGWTTDITEIGSGTNHSRMYADHGSTPVYITYTEAPSDGAPSIAERSPPDTYSDDDGIVNINCTVTDDYEVINISILTNSSGVWAINWTNTTTGTVNESYNTMEITEGVAISWACRACDNSSQCTESDNRTFNYDGESPVLTLEYPSDINNTVNRNYTYVNVSGNEDLYNCIIQWNGSNESMTESGNNAYKNMTGLNNGTYDYIAYCEDGAGNSNTTSPAFVIINETITPPAPVILNISVSDSYCYTDTLLFNRKAVYNGSSWIIQEEYINCPYGCDNRTISSLFNPACVESPEIIQIGIILAFIAIILLIRWFEK